MASRSRFARNGRVRSLWFLLAGFVVAWLSYPTHALALPPIRGAVDGRGLFEIEGRMGGAITTDFWLEAKALRAGGVLGVAAFSGRDGISSRVITPVGLSLAWVPYEDASGPTVLIRGGAYAGARKSGLYAGPWAGGAFGYNLDLGEGASVRFGLDTWVVLGDGSGVFLAPYVGLGF